jgi:diadenosine tetraphosphate (Ap4A) HIT family hydrolase
MSLRTPENQAAYERFKKSYAGPCVFCDIVQRAPDQIVETTATMMVLQNHFPYATWDSFNVGTHSMIVPKRHVGSLQAFNEQERTEYFTLLSTYESAHYSFYSRAPSNTARTVAHLHTHVLRPDGY